MYTLKSMVYYSQNPVLNSEIVMAILDQGFLEEVINSSVKESSYRAGKTLSETLQSFLHPLSIIASKQSKDYIPTPVNPETVKKIYNFSKTPIAQSIDENIYSNVLRYLAGSEQVEPEIAKDIIAYSMKKNDHHTLGRLLLNKTIGDDDKKQIINAIENSNPMAENPGVFSRFYATKIVQEYQNFSDEFIEWVAGIGFLDYHFRKQLQNDFVKKYGRQKNDFTEEEVKEETKKWMSNRVTKNKMEKAQNFADKWLSMNEEIEAYLCTSDRGIISEHDSIMKEIKDYFNNDDEYLKYDSHDLSSLKKLLDPDSPAPWDE
jgi:hypothetical protein